MMGDTTITDATRAKVRRLCTEAGVKDVSQELHTEQEAEAFMQDLQKRTKERAKDRV